MLLAGSVVASPSVAQTWLYESAHTIPSSDTGWNGIALDPAGTRLFIARRADGLTVWDTRTLRATTVENSEGANAVVLAPAANRGYAALSDGTIQAFAIDTLKPLERIDLGAGEPGTGFLEPAQNRVHFLSSQTGDKTVWVTLDAATGATIGRTEFNSRQMDRPASDGRGAIFAPMRDKSLLQQLDAKDLSLQKTWKLGDCTQPVAVEWDAAAERVLVACRGDKPVFVALNPAVGVVATIPIGRGVDGIVVDERRHLIVTAKGGDGTMNVIRQDSSDAYVPIETITTRPAARLLQLDPDSGRLFTVSATSSKPASGADGKAPAMVYHPDSFTILTFRPK
jgi:DNA-binding beta-propeller fold protein YncE